MVISVQKRNVLKHLYNYFSFLLQACLQQKICWHWLRTTVVAVSWHFPTVFICIGIPLVTSYCLCLSSQCPLSSTEPLLHPTPWPTVAAFPFIIQSPRSPSHASFCRLALLKALVQLTPLLCALPLIFIHFHCSATQFPPLMPWFFCCPVTLGTSPAWHCLKCCIQIQQQCSAVLQVQCHLPRQFSLLVVMWRPPVSSCVLQVHILSNEKLKQACCGWDHLDCFCTVRWKHFLQVPLPSWKYVRRE